MKLLRLVLWILPTLLLWGCSGLKVTRVDPPPLPASGGSPAVVSDEFGIRYYLPRPVAVVSTVDQYKGEKLIKRDIKVDVQLLPDPAHHYAVNLAQIPFSDDSFAMTLGPGQTLASLDVTRISQLVEVAKFAAQLAAKTAKVVATAEKPDPKLPEACQIVREAPSSPTEGPDLWLQNINKSLDELLRSPQTNPDSAKVLQSLLDAKAKVEPLTAPREKVTAIGQTQVIFLAKDMEPKKAIKGFDKMQCWRAVVFAKPLQATDQ